MLIMIGHGFDCFVDVVGDDDWKVGVDVDCCLELYSFLNMENGKSDSAYCSDPYNLEDWDRSIGKDDCVENCEELLFFFRFFFVVLKFFFF